MSQNVKLAVTVKSEDKKIRSIDYKKNHVSVAFAHKEIKTLLSKLHYEGYLLASVDSIVSDSPHVYATVNSGERYRFAYLRMGNLDPGLASRLGISEKSFFNKPFRYKEAAKSIEKIIVYYENNGYPFADVTLDSIQFENDGFHAAWNVRKNKFFKIDSIRIMGSARINRKFLFRYLNIAPGMPYNESYLAAISPRIKQLPFLTEKQGQIVQLTNKTNKLILQLDKKNASQFDGIIGFLPDAQTNKAVITGDVKIKLVNGIFRNGETFDLEWRRLQTQTQDFKGSIVYPYLFGSPVGADYGLKIYRRDTTFIDIHNNFGIQYYFKGLNYLKVFLKQRNTNLISTSGLSFVTTLPEYADITTQSYGAGVFFEKLNYRFNPHKGVSIQLNAQTGNRTIKKNAKVNELAYKNLLLLSAQYQMEGHVSWFMRLSGNNVLKLGIQGASIFGNSTIFRNELFRIGGLRTLRGFDEESIFASSYVIPTIEYRFLFSQNSNFVIFTEGAWYENNSNNNYINDTPVSVGAGVNLETKAGILTLNYAIGNQFGNGFDIRSGKIHFGLIALF